MRKKELLQKIKNLENSNSYYKMKSEELNKELICVKGFLKSLHNSLEPVALYYCKQRKTTYLKFANGNFQKVKLQKGEKDDLNTALAYCMLKTTLKDKEIKSLIKNVNIIKPGDNITKINSKKR